MGAISSRPRSTSMLELERFAILLIDICLSDINVNKNPCVHRLGAKSWVPQVSILRPGKAQTPPPVLKGHGFSRAECESNRSAALATERIPALNQPPWSLNYR